MIFNPAFAVRIGVVGAGVGGSTFSLWIKQQLPNVDITILEKNDRIGGRVLDFTFQNQTVEIGANLIILENLYFKQLSEDMGLQKNKFKERPSHGPGGFWNGNEFTFAESNWFIMDVIKGLMRFGYTVPSLVKSEVSKFLGRFTKIYDALNDDQAFSTPQELLETFDLLDPTTRDFREQLRLMTNLNEADPMPNYVDDVVGGVLKSNYASHFEVNGLVGLVSTAPVAVGSESAWNVKGGNRQLPTIAIEKSEAKVLYNKAVQSVKDQGSNVVVTCNDNESFEFDYLVIATPLHSNNQLLINDQNLKADFEMLHLWVTFVHGRLNGKYFGVDQSYIEQMESILVPESAKLEFNSIGKQAIDKDDSRFGLYKVFSMEPLTEEFFANVFFLGVKEIYNNDIDAYPKYDGPVTNWIPFELSPRVFYANALETAMSAMEVSILGAKNVANLLASKEKTKMPSMSSADVPGTGSSAGVKVEL